LSIAKSFSAADLVAVEFVVVVVAEFVLALVDFAAVAAVG
jgi:hypothetical protein